MTTAEESRLAGIDASTPQRIADRIRHLLDELGEPHEAP
jgi:hypothetical protein